MLTLLTGANKSILTEKTKRSINLSNAIPGPQIISPLVIPLPSPSAAQGGVL